MPKQKHQSCCQELEEDENGAKLLQSADVDQEFHKGFSKEKLISATFSMTEIVSPCGKISNNVCALEDWIHSIRFNIKLTVISLTLCTFEYTSINKQ